jgi:hypothetical protein
MVSFTSNLPPDVVSAEFSKGIVYLDLEQTPELEAEGFAREVIRRIQQMRKDMKLDVEEFVRIELECSKKVEGFIDAWRDHISRETRAREFEFASSPKGEYIVEWNVVNEPLLIGIASLGIKATLGDLASVPGLATDKALKLYDAGFKTAEALKAAQPDQLAAVQGISRTDANSIYEQFHPGDLRPAAAQPVYQAPVAPQPPPVQPAAAPAPTPPAPHEAPPPPAPRQPFIERLMAVDGVEPMMAEAIYEAGYINGQTMKNATVEDLTKIRGVSEPMATVLKAAFIDEPELAPARPPPTAAKAPPTIKDLERSFSYLVEEDKPETSYSLFINALKKGMKGYCITRNYPAKIRSKFDLAETPIVWLSNVGRDNAIRPKDLEKLSLSLEQFLSQSGGGIVLLDGLEYLITNNNFITVLRLIQSLRDQVAINQSILLMAVNRSTLESHQLNLLEREVDYTISG